MSDKLKELREKRAKAIHDMRNIVDCSEKAGNAKLSTDDQQQYDALFEEQSNLSDQIQQEEQLANLERETLAHQASNPATQRPENQPESDEDRRLKAFRMAILNGPNGVPADLMNALQFDDDAAGGYLSPPEQFVRDLIKALDNQTFMRRKATVITLTGAHSLGAPALDNDPADAAWTAEVGAVSEDSTMSFGKREMVPHQLTKLVKVSMKLLRNSALPAEQIVMDRLAYKFGITEEQAFLTGSGASQPLGVFTVSSSGISTGRDVSTGNSTTSITFDGLQEAKYSLKAQYQMIAEWLFHRDAVKQVAKLKDGEGQYLWQPSKRDGESDMLLGRPVNQSEYAPNTFTTGLYVGLFGDFSKYWIVDSLAMTVQRLMELYAGNNQVGIIGRKETDGAPVLEEAFARVKLA